MMFPEIPLAAFRVFKAPWWMEVILLVIVTLLLVPVSFASWCMYVSYLGINIDNLALQRVSCNKIIYEYVNVCSIYLG